MHDELVNKKCKLTFQHGFILDGYVREINDFGIWFETPQKTSFIAWNVIRELVPTSNGGGMID